MPPKNARVDELIQSISLHKPNKVAFHATVFPFMILYACWFYFWVFVYGIDEHYEAGLVTLVGIAFVQIFTCLCCFWSVHFRAWTSCRKVSWNFFAIVTYLISRNSITEQFTRNGSACESCANRKQRIQ